jgi:hypothetical protein
VASIFAVGPLEDMPEYIAEFLQAPQELLIVAESFGLDNALKWLAASALGCGR